MLEYLLFVIGLILLVKGADYLVEGASAMAGKLGVSGLAIGLTVVAFGTSMPELLVNVVAAVQGSGEVALGTIIGSNVSNTLLVLGVVASMARITLHKTTVWREVPFSLLAAVVILVLVIKGGDYISRADGAILLLFFAVFLYYVFGAVKHSRYQEEYEGDMGWLSASFMVAGGAVALYFGAEWVVDGVKGISSGLGLSEFMISALGIALGTSLPELTTCIAAAVKDKVDLAVGNIIGSNIFNVFWVLGFSAVVRPIMLPSFILIDAMFLMGISLLLFLFLFVDRKHTLERWQGWTFLALYLAYVAFLVVRG